jgi:mono/diheme cytochrome c family protein
VLQIAVAVTALTAACGDQATPAQDPAVRGAQVFADNCAACHGPDLKGTDTGPPLLHDYYKPSHHPDESFRAAVANGVQPHHWQFGPMPAFPGISAQDTDAVIAYIRSEQRDAGIVD